MLCVIYMNFKIKWMLRDWKTVDKIRWVRFIRIILG